MSLIKSNPDAVKMPEVQVLERYWNWGTPLTQHQLLLLTVVTFNLTVNECLKAACLLYRAVEIIRCMGIIHFFQLEYMYRLI